MNRRAQISSIAAVLLLFSRAASVAAPDAATPTPAGRYATIKTTVGTIRARLLPEQAPQSVAHFVALARGERGWIDQATGAERKTPYYDGIAIHKVEAGRRFEAGDPVASGRGGPFLFVRPELGGSVNFRRGGRLGLTRSAGGRISGVGFFVTAVGMPWLDGAHPCIGEVIEGQDVVRRISEVKAYSNGRPMDPPRILEVTVVEVGEVTPLPPLEDYHPAPPRVQRRTAGEPH